MANPRGINGTDVVLILTIGGQDIQIPAQRSAKQSETNGSIDMSSKDSRNKRVAAGRYASSLSLTALYLPGVSGYDAIQTAFRTGAYIDVIRQEPTSRTSWPAGSKKRIETASAIITEMSPDFPDQDASVISLTIEIDDGWVAIP